MNSYDEDAHPYWYGRIIGVFHAEVRHVGPTSVDYTPRRMDFLWVRWYGQDSNFASGIKAKRLPRVGFLDGNDAGAFGFVDPNELIRGAHLIPAFAHGQTNDMLPKSIARQADEKDLDYAKYYVGMYVLQVLFDDSSS